MDERGNSMKYWITNGIIGCLIVSFALTGCGQGRAASSEQAISKAIGMKTVEEKKAYLLEQAQLFFDARQYEDAWITAIYCRREVDMNTPEALEIARRSRAELEKVSKENFNKTRNKLVAITKQLK